MEKMLLHLESIDLHPDCTSDKPSAGGTIYITIGKLSFPENKWYDLVSVLLDIWLPRLLSFASNHTDTCDLLFMDGPCVVRFNRRAGRSVTVTALWNHQAEIAETEIDFPDFLESVAACLLKYGTLLYENGRHKQFQTQISVLGNYARTLRKIAGDCHASVHTGSQ